jgi:formylglycine-generating enzyme required for sulfatase activity
MAGSIANWAVPQGHKELQHVVSRGGAWCDWRSDCLLSARRPYSWAERTARVGFRLVRVP